ncbi:hypothetical protein [Phytomonospora endophytica]|uniref:Uncharacterized protein n=1 Tax=Phytomonospora endophytica TaxID=714109 RepID=A0A841FLI1_9ACTN|nr:hypothetical protein [Phytomonospora endophytica]MBB6038181.1 hypothetical protein [Phytomonospora endophytica]GIG67358.1 hypothetical protein Pen01_36530 [Phytomonospora endophytica]
MNAEYLRDAAMTAVIFGFFGMAWFGWAQEAPPPAARKFLGIGSVAGILLAIGGGLVAWQHWNDGSAITSETGPRFGIIVGVEVAFAAAGSVILTVRKKSAYIAPWIAAVVGIHFIPLATILETPLLFAAGALVTIGAWTSIRIARSRDLTISYVTGATTGSVLLLCALVSLTQALVAY